MGLSHEDVGPKLLAKIKSYILTRAELLFHLCYEIPCNGSVCLMFDQEFRPKGWFCIPCVSYYVNLKKHAYWEG